MTLIDPRITADRVRAALAFAGIDVKDSQAKVGISYATMERIVSPSKPRGASLDELRQIADACPGVPRWFLEHGFAPPAETGADELRQDLSDLRDDLKQLAATVAQQSRELRELRGQGHRRQSSADDPR